jgi:peptide/nickel transport system ATP-binding protein
MANPAHPYTVLLLESAPGRGLRAEASNAGSEFDSAGCAFRARCPRAVAECAANAPEPRQLQDGRLVACHLAATRS